MKRTRLRAISEKRRRENETRAELLASTFGPCDTWRCWVASSKVRGSGPCWGEVHGHEILKRSQGGSILDMDNVVLLCDYHNTFVEDNPRWGYDVGLVRHPWENP